MKKLITLLCLVFALNNLSAQYVTIPDVNFRNFLISKYPSCFNTAQQLDTNCTAITTEDSLYCSHLNITSINGIQYFDNLKALDCQVNTITYLPTLPATLVSLDCGWNKISTINNLPKNLKRLICQVQDASSVSILNLPSTLTIFNSQLSKINQLPALPATLDSLIVNSCSLYNLQSLPTNLKALDCSSNYLSFLPNFPSTLKYVSCGYNTSVTSIPTLPPQLISFFMGGLVNVASNSITLPSTLNYFGCEGCNWTSLPTLPNGLTYLSMSNNNFPVFPSNLPNSIVNLYANYCKINAISLLPSSLSSCELNNNNLTSLSNLPTNLSSLNIDYNLIKVLPTLPNTLTTLYWSSNSLDSIKPFLGGRLSLIYLNFNNLTSLPILPATLRTLGINGNDFVNSPTLPSGLRTLYINSNVLLFNLSNLPTTLRTLQCAYNYSLNCLPQLPSTLTSIYLDSTYIQCIPNKPANLIFRHSNGGGIADPNDYPICNPTNNSNHCVSFPTITGKAFHDINKNGIQDANEAPKAFGLVMLSNGSYTFTDSNGVYTIQTDTLGTFSVMLLGSSFYTNVPNIQYATANRYDTIIHLPNIALQPNTVVDSVQIFATPLLDKARPGFKFPYFIGYANVGTTTLSPNINFSYNSNYLNYDSCSNNSVVNANGQLSLTNNNMAAGKTDSYVGYLRVKPTATLGDTLKATASITSATTNAIFDAPYSIITGAFDPNEKDATPTLTPTQVALGKPVNYTIYFQNTGTDTAFNVVIADTLSSLLQTNALQVISSSHSCKVSVKNGVAYFEFLNIQLPDSNVNELRSHGFVRFTVKPKTNLTAGVNIYNKAYIYFDYNAAIVTNTAITKISNAIITPLKITSYQLSLRGTKESVENNWTTANETNVSHFDIQRSINGKDFITIGKIKANNKTVNEYQFADNKLPITNDKLILYYRIIAVDNDGQLSYSNIKQVSFNNKQQTINFYPNPATSLLNIEVKDAKQIAIIDYFGRTFYSRTMLNNQLSTINVQQFRKGIYVIQVVLQNGTIVNEKLVVE